MRRVHVDVLAFGAVNLDRLHVWLVSDAEGHHRLPSAQEVRTVTEFLIGMREVVAHDSGQSARGRRRAGGGGADEDQGQ